MYSIGFDSFLWNKNKVPTTEPEPGKGWDRPRKQLGVRKSTRMDHYLLYLRNLGSLASHNSPGR